MARTVIPNRTELALIARGVQSDSARVLREQGWTLAKLSCASDVVLASLGLHSETIKRLRKRRPSIPISNLIEVLFANRFLCCVCRDPLRPVIVHHIDAWSRTRDHSVSNLAVLCPIDHGKAHSTRDLEQTLSAPILRHFKQTWEDSVKRLDPIAIQKSTQPQSDQWLYFNHLRIFELAADNGIDLVALSAFQPALSAGVIDSAGNVTKSCEPGSFMYADSDGRILYRYVKAVLASVLDHIYARNVSDHLDRSVVHSVVAENDVIYVQGLHRFKASPSATSVQLATGTRTANNVQISFVFDKSEATSTSAWSIWLTGQNNVGSLVQVKRVWREDGKMHISGTVLAIRTAADGAKERMYELRLYESGIPQRRDLEIEDFTDLEEGFDD